MTILLLGTLTTEEMVWMASLPDELLRLVSSDDVKFMTRLEPTDWPEELRNKAEPYLALWGEAWQ